jgi:hypothetical protein
VLHSVHSVQCSAVYRVCSAVHTVPPVLAAAHAFTRRDPGASRIPHLTIPPFLEVPGLYSLLEVMVCSVVQTSSFCRGLPPRVHGTLGRTKEGGGAQRRTKEDEGAQGTNGFLTSGLPPNQLGIKDGYTGPAECTSPGPQSCLRIAVRNVRMLDECRRSAPADAFRCSRIR